MLAAAAVLIFGAVLPAQAAVITFGSGPDSILVGHADAFTEAGYVFAGYSNDLLAAPGDLVGLIGMSADCEANLSCPASTTPYYVAANDSYLDLQRLGSNTSFRLSSFDASFVGDPSAPAVPGFVRFQGVTAANISTTVTFALGGATNGVYSFSHFIAPTSFSSIDFVELLAFGFACNNVNTSCTAFNTDRAQFALDNIVLVDIPEPSDLFLVAIGLLGMTLVVRNRRSI